MFLALGQWTRIWPEIEIHLWFNEALKGSFKHVILRVKKQRGEKTKQNTWHSIPEENFDRLQCPPAVRGVGGNLGLLCVCLSPQHIVRGLCGRRFRLLDYLGTWHSLRDRTTGKMESEARQSCVGVSDWQWLGAEGRPGSVRLGFLEEAEQKKLAVGFGWVYHWGRWSSKWCFSRSPHIARFDVILPGLLCGKSCLSPFGLL